MRDIEDISLKLTLLWWSWVEVQPFVPTKHGDTDGKDWHRLGLEYKRLGIGGPQSDGRHSEHIGGEDNKRCQGDRERGGHKSQER